MYRVDTHTGAPVVKENQQGYRTAIRETFPDPQNGFELAANFHRSQNQKLLTLQERALYLLLCDYVGKKMDDKYWCCPAITTLQKTLGVAERSIRNWLGSLIEKGFITKEARIRKGSNTSNSYFLTPASQIKGVHSGAGGGVNHCAGGVVHAGAPKETRGEETSVEETTPQTPLAGGVSSVFRNAVKEAIADVCSEDKSLSDRGVSFLASHLIRLGYKTPHVYELGFYIRDNWPTYEGPIRLHHLRKHCEDEDVPFTLDTSFP